MDSPIPIIAVLALAVGLTGYKTLAEHRAARRNRRNCCGRCGARLPYEEHYRVEGIVVCPSCAGRARRLIVASFGVLALIGGAGLLAMVVGLFSGGRGGSGPGWLGVGMTALAVVGLLVTWRSLPGYMKQANLRAAEEERRSTPLSPDESRR